MKLTTVPSPPPSFSVFFLLVFCFLSTFLFAPPSIDFDVRPISSSPSLHSHSRSRSRSRSHHRPRRASRSKSKSTTQKRPANPATVIDLPVDNDSVVAHDIPKVCPPGAVHHDGHSCEGVKFNQVEETSGRARSNRKGRKTGTGNLAMDAKKNKKQKKQKKRKENELSSMNISVNLPCAACKVAPAGTVSASKSSSSNAQEKTTTNAVKQNMTPSVLNETQTSSLPSSLSAWHPHHSSSGPPRAGYARKMIKYSVIPLHEATPHVHVADYITGTVTIATTTNPNHSSNHVPTPSASVFVYSNSDAISSPSNKNHEQLPKLICPPGYTRREDGHPDECALTPSRALNRKHVRPYLTLPGCPLGYRPTNATSCACDANEAGRDDSACMRPIVDNGDAEEERKMMVISMPRTECPSGFSYRHRDCVCVRCPHYFELAHNGRVCVQQVVVEAV